MMNASNSQQASASLLGSMKSLTLVKGQEQETEGGSLLVRREGSGRDAMDYNLLSEGSRRQIRQLPISHSIQSIVSGETTQEDINEMVSQCFAAHCENYYRRCCMLDKLIEAEEPADADFMKTINSGPMYATDCCRYVESYVNKFEKHALVEGTVLSNTSLEMIIACRCPPMDIYEQVACMDVLCDYNYIVVIGGKATEALFALKNKFSIIDCGMCCDMAYYEVIMLLIGEENFNAAFGRGEAIPLVISSLGKAVYRFMSTSKEPDNDDLTQRHLPPMTVHKGSVYYFKNHKDYMGKHPLGVAKGFNVMLVDKVDKDLYFTAFGFPGRGLTPHKISQELVGLFNRHTLDDYKKIELYGRIKKLYGKVFDRLQYKTITLDELYANEGGWLSTEVSFLDINKIEKELGYSVLMRTIASEIVDDSVNMFAGGFSNSIFGES